MSAKPWHRSDKSDLAGSFFLETEKIIKQFGPNCLMIFFVSTATTREAPWPHTSMTTVQVLDCTNKTNLEADVLRWRCPRGLIKRTSNHGRSDFGPCDPYSECSYTPCRDLSATLHLQSPLLTLTINPLPAIFRLYGMLQVIQKQRVNTLLLTYSSVKATFLCTAQAVHHCTPIAVIHMLICAV